MLHKILAAICLLTATTVFAELSDSAAFMAKHTRLQVGALQCRYNYPEVIDLYTQYSRRNMKLIVQNDKQAREEMGSKEYDQFITQVANQAALELSEKPELCVQIIEDLKASL